MKFFFLLTTLMALLVSTQPLKGNHEPSSLLIVGGGWLDAGSNHSGGLGQVEYRWKGLRWCKYLRPQLSLLLPGFNSFYVGAGMGVELYLSERLVFTPFFSPGLYYQGNGRNLGYPLEFRSGLELCFKYKNGMRIGGQFYHLSNASLSNKNPGMNALVFILSLPL